MSERRARVAIVGGGFAGLAAARELARDPVEVTLVDRRNHHLFQPLLYQVATAGLSAPDIARPLRSLLRDQRNARVVLGEVEAIDAEDKALHLRDGEAITYDYLILAAGARNHYFGHDEWAAHAPGLKTLDDAVEIRQRILLAFERAEREEDAARRAALLTFVVVGGGPTGVELAGALAEIARHTMAGNFRRFDPAEARVILVEGGPRVLAGFSENLSGHGARQLEELGVEVRTGARVEAIDEAGVRLADGETLETATVIWGAGVAGARVAETLGVPLARGGRVEVADDLSLPGYPEVFVVGDLARVEQDGEEVPGMAPGAMQGGQHAARQVRRRLSGQETEPFRYVDKGAMATVGRSRAVARVAGMELRGWLAWVMWMAIHIFFLVGFRNRVRVMLDWAWAYWTMRRGSRLIFERPGEASGAVQAAPRQAQAGE
jgi:NADH dehydrogenase